MISEHRTISNYFSEMKTSTSSIRKDNTAVKTSKLTLL